MDIAVLFSSRLYLVFAKKPHAGRLCVQIISADPPAGRLCRAGLFKKHTLQVDFPVNLWFDSKRDAPLVARRSGDNYNISSKKKRPLRVDIVASFIIYSYMQWMHTTSTYNEYLQSMHTSKTDNEYLQWMHTINTYTDYIQWIHRTNRYIEYRHRIHAFMVHIHDIQRNNDKPFLGTYIGFGAWCLKLFRFEKRFGLGSIIKHMSVAVLLLLGATRGAGRKHTLVLSFLLAVPIRMYLHVLWTCSL